MIGLIELLRSRLTPTCKFELNELIELIELIELLLPRIHQTCKIELIELIKLVKEVGETRTITRRG